jgi:Protein of unknown function (DUF433)
LRAPDVNRYRQGFDRIVSDPEILGGEPVFKGTRIPLDVEYEISTPMRLVVLSLLDYLATCDLPVSRTRTEIDRQVVDVS